jgi:MFS family permease
MVEAWRGRLADRRIGLRLGRDNNRIFWGIFVDEAANGLVWSFLALYLAALGATSFQLGLALGLISCVQFVALLPSGWLAGHVGIRLVVLGGRSVTLLGLIGLVAGQRWWQAALGGTILVCGAIAWPAVSTAIAGNARDDAERTRSFRLCYTVGPSVALAATPALGGMLADAVALRAVFGAAIVLRLVAIGCFASVHWPERTPPSATQPRLSYRATLAHRPIRLLALLQVSTIFGLALGWVLAANYLRDVHGLSLGAIGRYGSLTAVGTVALGLLAGRLRWLRRPLAAVALGVVAMNGAFLLLLLGQGAWAFAPAFLLSGGYAAAWSLFYPAYGEVTPPALRTRAYALAELAPVLGKTAAPFLAGWLYAGAPRAPLVAALLLFLPILAATAWVGRALAGERSAGPQPATLAEEIA